MTQNWFHNPLYRAIFFVLFGIVVIVKSNSDPVVIGGGIFIMLAGIGLNYLAWQHQQRAGEQSQKTPDPS